jgi:importin subunit beta-1
MKFIASLT